MALELREFLQHLSAQGETLNVKVTPKASSNRLSLEQSEADGSWMLKAWVTAAPENGKANAALIKLLAKQAGLAKSSITLVSGETSRNKKLRFGQV